MGSLFSPALAFAVAALTAVCGLLLLVTASRRQRPQEPVTADQSPGGPPQAHTQQTTPSPSDPVTEPIPVPREALDDDVVGPVRDDGADVLDGVVVDDVAVAARGAGPVYTTARILR